MQFHVIYSQSLFGMFEFAWTIDVQMLKVLLKVLRSKSLLLYFCFSQFSLPPYMLCYVQMS